MRAARRAGYVSWGSDIVDRSEECDVVASFLDRTQSVPNIVCNPPFKIAREFVDHALAIVERKVAMILPARFVFGELRSRWLEKTPLRRVLAVVPRPSMPPGTVIEAGLKPGGGKEDFVVCVWLQNYDGDPDFGWLRRPPANDNVQAEPSE